MKNFLKTAILNKVGIWEGRAFLFLGDDRFINTKDNLSELFSVTKEHQQLKEMMSASRAVRPLLRPVGLCQIRVVDNNLECNRGIIDFHKILLLDKDNCQIHYVVKGNRISSFSFKVIFNLEFTEKLYLGDNIQSIDLKLHALEGPHDFTFSVTVHESLLRRCLHDRRVIEQLSREIFVRPSK